MTYRCTNPKCERKGKEPTVDLYAHNLSICPECGFLTEDLDLLERKAIRQDAGFSKEEAERLAIEDLEKWRKDLA
jgi:hypothetical protein